MAHFWNQKCCCVSVRCLIDSVCHDLIGPLGTIKRPLSIRSLKHLFSTAESQSISVSQVIQVYENENKNANAEMCRNLFL